MSFIMKIAAYERAKYVGKHTVGGAALGAALGAGGAALAGKDWKKGAVGGALGGALVGGGVGLLKVKRIQDYNREWREENLRRYDESYARAHDWSQDQLKEYEAKIPVYNETIIQLQNARPSLEENLRIAENEHSKSHDNYTEIKARVAALLGARRESMENHLRYLDEQPGLSREEIKRSISEHHRFLRPQDDEINAHMQRQIEARDNLGRLDHLRAEAKKDLVTNQFRETGARVDLQSANFNVRNMKARMQTALNNRESAKQRLETPISNYEAFMYRGRGL